MKDIQYRKLAKFLLNKLSSLAKEQGDEIMLDKINSRFQRRLYQIITLSLAYSGFNRPFSSYLSG